MARWYDPEIGHFAQPDSIVPGAGDALAWDRYAYVKNNPIKYVDPSGKVFIEYRYARNGAYADNNPRTTQYAHAFCSTIPIHLSPTAL